MTKPRTPARQTITRKIEARARTGDGEAMIAYALVLLASAVEANGHHLDDIRAALDQLAQPRRATPFPLSNPNRA